MQRSLMVMVLSLLALAQCAPKDDTAEAAIAILESCPPGGTITLVYRARGNGELTCQFVKGTEE